MKHRLLACCLTMLLLVSLLPAAAANPLSEQVYLDSGYASVPKMTPSEINALLDSCPSNAYSSGASLYSIQPSAKAPYAAGAMRTEVLQSAVDRLNALRKIAGLPGVKLDASLCENAQYGAVLLAASSFSHSPPQPEDMDDTFYQLGLSATSSSNIAWGYPFVGAIDGFMNDSNSSNIDRLGHRRWQLNPAMGKIGFGRCDVYTVEKVFDRSATVLDYNFIAWPSSGWFSQRLFDSNQAWSVTLSPSHYKTPVRDQVKVTLTRLSDGKSWTFDSSQTYGSTKKYFNVETSGYGVSNCIIFRPDDVDRYEGTYIVRIDGLKNSNGQATSFQYQVRFSSDFPDVPEDAFYTEPVHWALLNGVTTGTSELSFSPNISCTRAQIVTFLWRAKGKLQPTTTNIPFVDADATAYYYDPLCWALENKITNGINETQFGPELPCTRAQVLTFLWRAAGSPEPERNSNPFVDVQKENYYYKAVLWAVEN
ncbi:MAG: S-layer homology domain-containing protein, partial [Oscillospiraceae bacterium]|nr:S-layer homology domain-containing protein [Oscillospiraceae bacterium]